MGGNRTIEDFLVSSDRLIAEQDWEAESRLMEEAKAAFPSEPEFWIRHALAICDDRLDDSATSVRKAAELASTDPGMLMRCASLLFDLGQFDDSAHWVKQVVRLAPDDFPLIPDALHLAGKLAAKKGNVDVAKTYLAKAFDVDPEGVGHAKVLVELLMTQGCYEEALNVIARALEHNPLDRVQLVDLKNRIADDN